ncbi:hypothetical protein BVY04_02440 [bacterium M21]|nr:hypothetical protein BVY04_02440 [bacterium M21]
MIMIQSLACSVPVFRYALERWPPAPYRMYLFHDGELADADKKVVDRIEGLWTYDARTANLALKVVDVSQNAENEVYLKYVKEKGIKLPCMTMLYPLKRGRQNQDVPLGSWALTNQNLDSLIASPVRSKITEMIVDGASSVWLFIESGDEKRDKIALENLKTALKEIESLVEVPDSVAMPGEDKIVEADDQLESGIELKISFPVVTMSRKDTKEEFLLKMLSDSEDGLAKLTDEPWAIPLFGRGRALYALVGEGISQDNIEETCAYLSGACSCQVKDMNPGTDILFGIDWDAVVITGTIEEKELPPLGGAGDLVAAAPGEKEVPETAVVAESENAVGEVPKAAVADVTEGGAFQRIMITAAIAVFGLVLFAGLLIKKKG